MKTCKKCHQTKSLSEYYKSGYKDHYRNECISCHQVANKGRYVKEEAVARSQQWRKDNPERFKENQRKRRESKREEISFKHFCYRFNLNEEEATRWLNLKGNPCLICSSPSSELDHNHETLEIRGWLCGNCNRGLGLFKDNPDTLRMAAEFLEKFT